MARRWSALVALCAFALAPSPAPAREAAAPRFEIRRFVLEGATLLPPARLAAATEPFLGPARGFGDVQRALEALELAYREAGFGAVQVTLPEQELEGGEIRLRVREMRLGQLRVEGARHFDARNVRSSLPSLAPGRAPNAYAIARELRLANDNPAKRAAVLLRAGADDADLEAVVRVVDRPAVRYTASVDSSGTPQTGRARAGLGLRHANLAGRDQVLRLHLTAGDAARIAAATLRVPLQGLGDAFELMAGDANTASGRAGELFEVSGAGTVYSLRYVRNLRAGLAYRDAAVLGRDQRAYDGPPAATVRPWSLAYQGRWRQPGGAGGFVLGAWRDASDEGYTLWRWTLDHEQVLGRDWRLRLGAGGQASGDRLVPGERFGLGGAQSVRGFEERALTGDRGYRGTLELRAPLAGMAVLAFYDWGGLRASHPLPGEALARGISSAGVGLRATRADRLALVVDWARVIDPATPGERGGSRVHASLSYAF